MEKKGAHVEEVEEAGGGDEMEASVGVQGGSERGLMWKAKMVALVIIAATVLRFIDKPIAAVFPQYPIIDNLSNGYNWAYGISLGNLGNFIYSTVSGKVSGGISLPSIPSGETQANLPAAPQADAPAPQVAAAPAPQQAAEPTRQCADWRQCIGNFSLIHGYFEWRVAEDADKTVYCVYQPAAGDKWNVTGYVFGLEDGQWGDYYNSNHIPHPPNDIYTGDRKEAIRQYDQTCDNRHLQKPAVQPNTPTAVPQPAAVQAAPQGETAGPIQDISLKFGGAMEGATGIILTTKIVHICLYRNQEGDTDVGISRRLGFTDPAAYGYYAHNSPYYAAKNDNIQGLYFQSQSAVECHN